MEAVLSMAIAAVAIAGVVTGCGLAAQQTEQAASSAAAGFMAQWRLEQSRAAKWDSLASPPVDELVSSNFPVLIAPLDVPVAGSNAQFATNLTTITTVSTDPPLKMIRVECVWSLLARGPFTNTLTTWRAPDQ
jgi:hypothetical protein